MKYGHFTALRVVAVLAVGAAGFWASASLVSADVSAQAAGSTGARQAGGGNARPADAAFDVVRSTGQRGGGMRGQMDGREMRMIEVKAIDFRFRPSELTVKPGEKIHLMLQNEGEAPHNIEFKFPGKSVKIEEDVAPGKTGMIDFTAPQQEGTYTFFCPVGDHLSLGMEGRLNVRKAK